MRTGYLGTIRWEPFPGDRKLSQAAGTNAVVRAFLSTGIPRPPQSMSVLDEAKFFLRCAAEIEHGLLIQYLYALYSLNVDDPTVGGWTATLREIAVEEMGHLLTVQNLLLALGDEPYFDRQYLATDPFPFQLEPLSRSSLAKYVTTESPGTENIADLGIRARVEAIESIAMQTAQNPEPIPVYDPSVDPLTVKHVGGMYAWIYWLFMPSDTISGPWDDLPTAPFLLGRHLRAQDFTGMTNRNLAERQAKDSKHDWGLAGTEQGPVFVREILSSQPDDKHGALNAIYKIAVQGEGFTDEGQSHFQRFLAMFAELEKLEDQGIAVSRQLATSPSVFPNRPGRTIKHPVSKLWARLFNVRYEMLLLKLSKAMGQKRLKIRVGRTHEKIPDHNPVHRSELIRDAVNREMLTALRPIADRLSRLPLKPRHTGRHVVELAGPTFELPDDPLPTQTEDVSARLIELIGQCDLLLTQLRKLRPAALGADAVDIPTARDKETILLPIKNADSALLKALKAEQSAQSQKRTGG